jgi:cellulose synthase/poly-beta-1,6-N-acetylglucosamine synthase-like glycosyltransferase
MEILQHILLYSALFVTIYFQVFLFLTYIGWRENKDDVPGFDRDDLLPSVSIMVPCYNEETTVVGTIESLLGSTYPQDRLKIIVIDDGSKDHTWDVVQKFANHSQVVLLQKKNEGSKFAALNYGLKHVNTDIVGCLDADSSVDHRAIWHSVQLFSRPDVYAVVPSMVIDHPKSFMQHMQKVEYELATYLKRVLHQLEALYVAPGPLTLFRKEVFDTLGEYEEAHHTEDLEIALRMQIHGMRLAHAADSLVYTKGPRTWPALLKQRIRWTYGFIKNVQDYRSYLFSRELGDLSFFILPLSLVSVLIAVLLFPFALYQLIAPMIQGIERILVTGFHLRMPHVDIFTIPNEEYVWLGYIGFFFLIFGLVIGRRVILKQKLLSWDLLTTFVYPFFASWWTIRSVVNALLSKKSSWR